MASKIAGAYRIGMLPIRSIFSIYTSKSGASMETTAKLFKNGSSQAVRLPKECRFAGDEVVVKRFGDMVILVPMRYSYRGLMAQLRDMGPIRLGRRAQPRRRDKRDF
jgi:antitoxin VapB